MKEANKSLHAITYSPATELCWAETNAMTALPTDIECDSIRSISSHRFLVYFVCSLHITSRRIIPSHSALHFLFGLLYSVCTSRSLARSLSLSLSRLFVVFRILSCFQRTPSYSPFLHFSLLTPTNRSPSPLSHLSVSFIFECNCKPRRTLSYLALSAMVVTRPYRALRVSRVYHAPGLCVQCSVWWLCSAHCAVQ